MDGATRSVRNPERGFPMIFGANALRVGADTRPDLLEETALA
jgi:hypothetical protein